MSKRKMLNLNEWQPWDSQPKFAVLCFLMIANIYIFIKHFELSETHLGQCFIILYLGWIFLFFILFRPIYIHVWGWGCQLVILILQMWNSYKNRLLRLLTYEDEFPLISGPLPASSPLFAKLELGNMYLDGWPHKI